MKTLILVSVKNPANSKIANSAKSEFVPEDGTIAPSAEKHVVFEIKINSWLTFRSH